MMNKSIGFCVLIWLLSACGEGNRSSDIVPKVLEGTVTSIDNALIPNTTQEAEYKILIIGNSHGKDIESLLNMLFEYDNVTKNVTIESLSGTFLDTIVNHESIVEIVQKGEWTHVILQGQKYSQSQSTLYSTDATITLIMRAKAIGAMPILFPEHPPLKRPYEAEYVQAIHESIATEQSSCVAPVGLTWNQVLSISPDLDVHEPDKNHATPQGALLSSMVLYEVISSEPADLLPFIKALPADSATQALFGQVTSQTINANSPCDF
jgi:hypothetical protein